MTVFCDMSYVIKYPKNQQITPTVGNKLTNVNFLHNRRRICLLFISVAPDS
jgi:hypothetical protein